MQMKELIILAGGLGTRLRSEVPELPKCMAPVNGRPFIDFVIDYFFSQNIESFIFALGYKSDILRRHLVENYRHLSIEFTVEEEPLGTGGAIKLACSKTTGEHVFIANGDTLFKADINALTEMHLSKESQCTLTLKPMQDFDRFGRVAVDENNCVVSFDEKKYYQDGLINGGLYALDVQHFLNKNFEQKFSFEKDYLEKFARQGKFFASVQSAYFIDMGIPEDYHRAAIELK
jgi:D-glycero-alpha-D-manno-heptose 1-phosphate guanylyltransferase